MIVDVTITVSQVSRVAVVGANDAGKSTAVKVLAAEQNPTDDAVWKAANLRIAYIAQHAFHHLEKHVQETPTAYITWRSCSSLAISSRLALCSRLASSSLIDDIFDDIGVQRGHLGSPFVKHVKENAEWTLFGPK